MKNKFLEQLTSEDLKEFLEIVGIEVHSEISQIELPLDEPGRYLCYRFLGLFPYGGREWKHFIILEVNDTEFLCDDLTTDNDYLTTQWRAYLYEKFGNDYVDSYVR